MSLISKLLPLIMKQARKITPSIIKKTPKSVINKYISSSRKKTIKVLGSKEAHKRHAMMMMHSGGRPLSYTNYLREVKDTVRNVPMETLSRLQFDKWGSAKGRYFLPVKPQDLFKEVFFKAKYGIKNISPKYGVVQTMKKTIPKDIFLPGKHTGVHELTHAVQGASNKLRIIPPFKGGPGSTSDALLAHLKIIAPKSMAKIDMAKMFAPKASHFGYPSKMIPMEASSRLNEVRTAPKIIQKMIRNHPKRFKHLDSVNFLTGIFGHGKEYRAVIDKLWAIPPVAIGSQLIDRE